MVQTQRNFANSSTKVSEPTLMQVLSRLLAFNVPLDGLVRPSLSSGRSYRIRGWVKFQVS